MDTLVHEANHFLNGKTSNGTPERFLDEFRAMVVGIEAAQGHPVSPQQQKKIIDELVDGSNPATRSCTTCTPATTSSRRWSTAWHVTLAGGPDGKATRHPWHARVAGGRGNACSSSTPTAITLEQARQRRQPLTLASAAAGGGRDSVGTSVPRE